MKTKLAQRILENCYDEWRAGTSEKDLSPSGRLAGIFRDVGWSSGVSFTAAGKVNDWCGFFAGASCYRAGMAAAHRKSFYHCMNVEDFATYGRPRLRNPKRLMREGLIDGQWVKVEDWHRSHGLMRTWLNEAVIRSGPVHLIDIQPADIVLLDYQGTQDRLDDETGDEADHITVAAEFRDGVLEVMNGNASGKDVNGNKVTDAVARTVHDLNDPVVRRRIYGVCRLSDLDFVPGQFR